MKYFFSLIVIFYTLITYECMANSTDEAFQSFWNEFRIAVIKEDYATLEKFTKFPLKIRGPDDSMPTEYFRKDDFKDIFDRIMQQKTYLPNDEDSLIKTSMKEIVDNTLLISDMKNGEQYQIEQLVFEYINGQWFFTNAYLEE